MPFQCPIISYFLVEKKVQTFYSTRLKIARGCGCRHQWPEPEVLDRNQTSWNIAKSLYFNCQQIIMVFPILSFNQSFYFFYNSEHLG